MRFDSRLSKLQSNLDRLEKHPVAEFTDVLELIRQGVYYDELSADQKNRYCMYYNIPDRKAFEDVQVMVYDSLHEDDSEKENPLHFRLMYKEKPLTKEQFAERVKWVEEQVYMDDSEG